MCTSSGSQDWGIEGAYQKQRDGRTEHLEEEEEEEEEEEVSSIVWKTIERERNTQPSTKKEGQSKVGHIVFFRSHGEVG